MREPLGLADIVDDTELAVTLTRPELALEAIRAERRLVLLGEPGRARARCYATSLCCWRRARGVKPRPCPAGPPPICPCRCWRCWARSPPAYRPAWSPIPR
ncbi:MAG: hypothetical protein MI924_04210 [Chloroflexales bacterium]|nr:hypothetical protein [Chloroflexales bacterium]